ncbi:hypothetical protein SFRURICE_010146 [Spodoptera frugiperda]|nr:hypothetical protein SFRURICE_010146 [Spodoptera frugiperda]
MDVTDLSKVAGRKRMNTDAEKLREKVSRETAKIIKLKVAQDTAYWDLKERLQQLQGAHERLQQNMVDVQMQHEAASAHYTRELRLRPATLNQLAGARGVCDALEDYGERLRRCVGRARADRAALQAAYGHAGARLRQLAADLGRARRAERSKQCYSAVRAGRRGARRETSAAQALAAAREELCAARAHAHELAADRAALQARLRQADEAAAAMRGDVSRLVQQFDSQAADMKRTIARLEDEAGAARRAADARDADIQRHAALLEEAKNTIDHLKEQEVRHLQQSSKEEMLSLQQRVSDLEAEKITIKEQLNETEQERGRARDALDEQTSVAGQLRRDLDDARAQLQAERAALGALQAAAAAGQRELDASTGTIARLMADLRAEADARARADAGAAAARRQHEAERDAARHAELQLRDTLARLERDLQDKDRELAAQMTVILDMRGEKERLQERIQGMQNTIDNIQKELTGRLAAPKVAPEQCEPPELDDTPTARRADDTVFGFLSDGSVDGDALDVSVQCATCQSYSAASSQYAVYAGATCQSYSAASSQYAVYAGATCQSYSAASSQYAVCAGATCQSYSAASSQYAVCAGATCQSYSAASSQYAVYAGATCQSYSAASSQYAVYAGATCQSYSAASSQYAVCAGATCQSYSAGR